MFKTQLSSNLVPEKVLIAILWILTMLLWKSIPGLFSPIAVLLLLIALIIYGIYIVYVAATNISYDEAFLFIADRKTEKIVPLANITHVKKSLSLTSPRTRWKIIYLDHDNIEDELSFYPEDNEMMVAFIKAVRKQNPIAQFD